MGTFDDIIRQEIAARGNARLGNVNRGDPSQEARDAAARRINVRERGVQSTALPSPFSQNDISANNGQSENLPRNAPIPVARPLDTAVDEQAEGEGVPLPQARPNPNAMEMGDANVMQAVLGGKNMQLAGVPDNVGNMMPNPMPATNGVVINGGGNDNSAAYVALLASIGGVAGAAQLYRRWQLGDADAARTFAAVGIDPNDFSMFAQQASAADRRAAMGPIASNGNQPTGERASARVASAAAPVAPGAVETPYVPIDPGMTPEEEALIRADAAARGGPSNPPGKGEDAGKGDRAPKKGKSAMDDAIDSTMTPEEKMMMPAQGNPVDVTETPRYRKPRTSSDDMIRNAVKLRPKVKVKR